MLRSAGMLRNRGCLCCENKSLHWETTVVSQFLARRAWGGSAELTRIGFCNECGFRFFERGLTDVESNTYYAGYRDLEYLRDRHRCEPFYTEKAYDQDSQWLHSSARQVAIMETLRLAGAPRRFSRALDYGGGTGHLLLGIEATHKAVFDVSGEQPAPEVVSISSPDDLGSNWDFVLNCQVLEHVSDPLGTLMDIGSVMAVGGWLYVEVPDQPWSNMTCPSALRDRWLAWLVGHRLALMTADCFSTACRVKLGILPPFGFNPMREHLNYFTSISLAKVTERSGLAIAWTGTNSEGCHCVVATKRLPH